MDRLNTHIGIGLAGNADNIVVVFLVTQRDIAILEIVEVPEAGRSRVDVRGKILSPNTYIFMASVYDMNFKEVAETLYDRVEFNRQTKDFVMKIDGEINLREKRERRWIQIYTSPNEPIGTRKPSK